MDHKSKRIQLSMDHKSPSIDEDLFAEILKRLPAETVWGFRCVCKSWNTLISSSFFVNLHHSHHSPTFSAMPEILKPHLRRLGHKTTTYPLNRFRKPDLPLYFPFPFRHQECDHLGAACGVVCFSYKSKFPHDSIVLWNPIIRKYVALPTCHKSIQQDIGFGYDITNHDFKVVRVLNRPSFFEVYSLKQGTWKLHNTLNEELFDRFGGGDGTGGFYWNGTINWIVCKESSNIIIPSILTFDCTLEEFRILELPINHEMKFKMKLLEYMGMFSLAGCYAKETPLRIMETRLDLWVMQVYGDSTTWKKIYCTRDDNYIVSHLDPYPRINRWIDLSLARGNSFVYPRPTKRIYEAMYRVDAYEETLFLMDHVKAISYELDEHILLV